MVLTHFPMLQRHLCYHHTRQVHSKAGFPPAAIDFNANVVRDTLPVAYRSEDSGSYGLDHGHRKLEKTSHPFGKRHVYLSYIDFNIIQGQSEKTKIG